MAAGAAVARWMADVDDLFGMNVRSGKRSGTPDRMFGRPTCESLEDEMTSPDQSGHRHRTTQQQPAGRFSLPRGKSAWIGITLSLIALVAVSAALVAVAIGGGTHQATSGGPSPAAGAALGTTKAIPAPNGTSMAKGNVISAAKLAESGGALSLPTRMQNPAFTWQSSRGGKDLAAVSTQFGDTLQMAGIRQYSEMEHTCIRLAGSVATAEAGPQIPDAAMQTLYATALAELAKGAGDCRAAISSKPNGDESVDTHVDATLLHLSISELAAGARDIFRATAEIEIVSRQHH